jgi:hypothetical protein
MTSVYVVAPQDLNFAVQYPKLGINRSGFVQNGGKYEPSIASYTNVPAYAIDEGIGQNYPNSGIADLSMIRVWRVTYTNSNSAEDIMITVNPNHGTTFGTYLRNKGPGIALITGILVAILFWILAWYFLAPRLVGKNKRIRGLWQMSLPYLESGTIHTGRYSITFLLLWSQDNTPGPFSTTLRFCKHPCFRSPSTRQAEGRIRQGF